MNAFIRNLSLKTVAGMLSVITVSMSMHGMLTAEPAIADQEIITDTLRTISSDKDRALTVSSERNHAELTPEEYATLKKKSFANATAGYFSTLGKNPYFHLHDHFGGNNVSFKFAPALSSLTKSNNFGVIARTNRSHSSGTKEDVKLEGDRKALIGIKLVNLLQSIGVIPKRTYDENPFVEAYLDYVPMKWTLSNVAEFRVFASQLDKRWQDLKLSLTEKRLLVLSIKGDPELKTLTASDLALLNKYFVLTTLEDDDVKEFFETHWGHFSEENNRLEGANPEYVAETLGETLLRKLEKACHKLESDKVAIALIGYLAAKAILDPITDEFTKPIKNNVAKWIAEFKAKFSTPAPSA